MPVISRRLASIAGLATSSGWVWITWSDFSRTPLFSSTTPLLMTPISRGSETSAALGDTALSRPIRCRGAGLPGLYARRGRRTLTFEPSTSRIADTRASTSVSARASAQLTPDGAVRQQLRKRGQCVERGGSDRGSLVVEPVHNGPRPDLAFGHRPNRLRIARAADYAAGSDSSRVVKQRNRCGSAWPNLRPSSGNFSAIVPAHSRTRSRHPPVGR